MLHYEQESVIPSWLAQSLTVEDKNPLQILSPVIFLFYLVNSLCVAANCTI